MKGIGQEMGRLSGESVGFLKTQWQKNFGQEQQQCQQQQQQPTGFEPGINSISSTTSSSSSFSSMVSRVPEGSNSEPRFALWSRTGNGSALVQQAGQSFKSLVAQTREGVAKLQTGGI